MSSARRLSICYVAPGHDLLSTVGPSRNVMNLARALSRWADVTIAFRRVTDERKPEDLRVLEIQPGHAAAGADDAAMQGMGYGQFVSFMRALHRFTRAELPHFDVVLEKSWLLSGYISELCRRRGQLGVPIENIVVNPQHAARRNSMKLLRLRVGHWIAGRAIRKAPLVIAETEFLQREIAAHWGVAKERIAVAELGVDRSLFQPMDRLTAQERLGIAPAATVLTYVGVLDYTHNLEPAIRALGKTRTPGVELHIVGDGMRRDEYRQMAARAGAQVIFHGRVEHAQVPVYIAAADLCLAPYDAAAFASGELGYSTMKIPEYLAVGRAVVSVPSGRVRSLVRDGQTGFLFANELENWVRFLETLPPRGCLREMCDAAAATVLTSWEDTARRYLSLCEQQLQKINNRGR